MTDLGSLRSRIIAGAVIFVVGIIVFAVTGRYGLWISAGGIGLAVSSLFSHRDLHNRTERERLAAADPWDPKGPVEPEVA